MSFGALLDGMRGLRAVVIGDLMLDEYIHGSVQRISPEAPVMVVRQQNTRRLPGGAANVARNLLALGAKVTSVGIVGEDGDILRRAMDEMGLDHGSVITDPDRVTTRKTRILADHSHQVLRVDHEETGPLSDSIKEQLLAESAKVSKDADLVIVSDYTKGTVWPELVRAAAATARFAAANIKPASAAWYEGFTLVSLNKAEAAALLGRDVDPEQGLEAAREIRRRLHVGSAMVTLGASGLAAAGEGEYQIPGVPVELADPAGAGDTTIAAAALGAASAGFRKEVFELAASLGACVVRHVGVAAPTREDLDALR